MQAQICPPEYISDLTDRYIIADPCPCACLALLHVFLAWLHKCPSLSCTFRRASDINACATRTLFISSTYRFINRLNVTLTVSLVSVIVHMYIITPRIWKSSPLATLSLPISRFALITTLIRILFLVWSAIPELRRYHRTAVSFAEIEFCTISWKFVTTLVDPWLYLYSKHTH